MSFQKGDIGFFLSGGSSNNNINSSIGGAISSTTIVSALANNLFPDVTPQQALSGIVRYRCFYVRNLNGTLQLQNPKIWIASNTLSAFDEIDIAIGIAAKNAAEPATSNESTAPSNITFTHPTSEVTALDIPSLNPNDYKSVWVRLTVQANSNPIDNNAAIIRVRGTPV